MSLLDDFGIGGLSPAEKSLDVAIENFGKTNTLSSSEFSVPTTLGDNLAPPENYDVGWKSVSYAHSLANSMYRPKLKFMFYVDFAFKPEIEQTIPGAWRNNFNFMVKGIDRPKMNMEYEDVNQYNYKTKVLKSIKTEEVSISFYDDGSNYVQDFYRFLMTTYSPITRRSNVVDSNIINSDIKFLDGSGMSFDSSLTSNSDYASRGVINTDNGEVLQAIKLTQSFHIPSSIDGGAKEVSYLFVNPHITSIEMNELSHEDTSSTSEIHLKFTYDFVIIPKIEDMKAPRNPMPNLNDVDGDIPKPLTQNAPSGDNYYNPQKMTSSIFGGDVSVNGIKAAATNNINLQSVMRASSSGLSSMVNSGIGMFGGSNIGISSGGISSASSYRPSANVVAFNRFVSGKVNKALSKNKALRKLENQLSNASAKLKVIDQQAKIVLGGIEVINDLSTAGQEMATTTFTINGRTIVGNNNG